jgi:hypothetical protein
VPALLSAQVVQSERPRRIVGVKSRGVLGTRKRVPPGLAAGGRQSNTACGERRNLDIRPRGAAVGRRGQPRCQGEDGVRQPLVVYHASANVCLPHARLRQPLPPPEPTNGTGSAQQWRPCPPAMAAGLPDHGWPLRARRLCRVPPGPPPQVR